MAGFIRNSAGENTNADIRRLSDIIPDHAKIGFNVGLPGEMPGDEWICDCVLIIPHTGFFILDVQDEENTPVELHRLGRYRRPVQERIKEKFLITPFVYEMLCLPSKTRKDFINGDMSDGIDPDFIIFRDDLRNNSSLMLKLLAGKRNNESLYGIDSKTDDISDLMTHRMAFYWENGIAGTERPEKPPMVFLSYNTLNQSFAGEIKGDLENRGVFVWRAPEDVPISDYYKTVETEAIRKCNVFFILISTSSQKSEEVRYEFEKATEEKKPILPLWIDDCETNGYYEPLLNQYRQMKKLDFNTMSEIEQIVKEA